MLNGMMMAAAGVVPAEPETFGTMGEASVGENAALRTMYALQFTPTWGGTVTQAQIHDLGGGAQTWTVAIHLDSAGSPGAQVGAASNPKNTVIDVITFDWATPPSVSASVTYWAVATRTSSGSRLATVSEVSGVVTGCGNSLGAISDGSDVDAGTDVRMGVTVTP